MKRKVLAQVLEEHADRLRSFADSDFQYAIADAFADLAKELRSFIEPEKSRET